MASVRVNSAIPEFRAKFENGTEGDSVESWLRFVGDFVPGSRDVQICICLEEKKKQERPEYRGTDCRLQLNHELPLRRSSTLLHQECKIRTERTIAREVGCAGKENRTKRSKSRGYANFVAQTAIESNRVKIEPDQQFDVAIQTTKFSLVQFPFLDLCKQDVERTWKFCWRN